MEQIKQTLSVRLRAYLTVRRETYLSLASRAGVAQSTVHSVIHGRHCPSAETVGRLARSLGCKVSDLVY